MNNIKPLLNIIEELPHRRVTTGTLKEDIQNILNDADDAILTGIGACAVVSGESGSGKTVLLEKVIERFNAIYQSSKIPSKGVYIRSPSNMKPLDLLRKMLSAFGEPGEVRGTEDEMRRRITKQIINKNIKLMVFDEFQQVVEKLGEKSVRQHADYLKELLDEYNLFLVFAGTPRVTEILNANEQFESRCNRVIHKSLMSVSTPESYSILASYLTTLQSVHKIAGTDLSHPSVVLPIQHATGGDLRRITRTLVKACQHARRDNRDKLSKDDFQASWVPSSTAGKRQVVNPFRRQLSVLKKDMGVSYDI
ncbi:ATP-binding protein [Alteromonas sp. 1_MG-2023]|uniref:ATP-binding protein n=1 Tax=Alteromonas sp. 1_MG-2023 TaxID=3062669 RepID=UPI0026E3DACF|nr:ATP-binding protein [Alteromonas sp. 1_MG-2023]MDO6566267.1 ATP-binding protein [Alteromonas sp. 1_MG-2023]